MIASAMAWLASSRMGRWLAIAGAVVIVVVSAFWMGRRDGGEAARHDQTERNLEAREKADEAAAAYRSDGGARRRLRDGSF
jgi:FtsZ-interacting cell division protein ZipA